MKKHIAQFFKFLQDKEGKPAPLKVMYGNANVFKLTKEELNVKGTLDLSITNIKELPQGLKVGTNLNLEGCTSLKELPQGLNVGSHLSLHGCTSLKELPQDLQVGGSLYLGGCTSLKELPQDLQVGWSLWLNGCTSLEKLPQGLRVDRNLNLEGTPIAEKYSEEEIRKIIEDGGGFVEGEINV